MRPAAMTSLLLEDGLPRSKSGSGSVFLLTSGDLDRLADLADICRTVSLR